MSVQVNRSHYFKEKYLSIHRFISYFHQVDSVRRLLPKKILFIGVGDGIVSGFLKKHPDYEVTTFDIDPELEPDVTGDVRALPFENESFDLVCAFEVLEHLPFVDSQKALAEIARVSRRDVLISIPHRRAGFEFALRFPGIRSLMKRSYLRATLLFSLPFGGYKTSGQHYWEIDLHVTPLSKVRKILLYNFSIIREYTPLMDHYHRFFELKKRGNPFLIAEERKISASSYRA